MKTILNDKEIAKLNLSKDDILKKVDLYRQETKKYAIWDDTVTKGFINWLKGEKIYDKNKKRISFYVDEEISDKWMKYMKKRNFSTLSKLIRTAVNDCIEHDKSETNFKKFSDISHDLKQPLTSIKGFSQLLLEGPYREELSEEILLTIENIFEQSKTLENKIKNVLDTDSEEDIFDILLIEDDQATIKLITTFLNNKGYRSKGVMGGSKALEILEISKPKLILLDIMLPDISGSDLCKKIKSNEGFKNIPIYFLTGRPEGEVKSITKDANADGYILKPFDFADFQEVFKHLD